MKATYIFCLIIFLDQLNSKLEFSKAFKTNVTLFKTKVLIMKSANASTFWRETIIDPYSAVSSGQYWWHFFCNRQLVV